MTCDDWLSQQEFRNWIWKFSLKNKIFCLSVCLYLSIHSHAVIFPTHQAVIANIPSICTCRVLSFFESLRLWVGLNLIPLTIFLLSPKKWLFWTDSKLGSLFWRSQNAPNSEFQKNRGVLAHAVVFRDQRDQHGPKRAWDCVDREGFHLFRINFLKTLHSFLTPRLCLKGSVESMEGFFDHSFTFLNSLSSSYLHNFSINPSNIASK